MTSPLTLPNPLEVTWLHGTKSTKFSEWKCPPPPPSPADVAHSAIFFTADRSYAEAAGANIAAVQLRPDAKIITPVDGGTQSSALRNALLVSNPLAAHCQWLVDDKSWIAAWSTGDVMRFAYDTRDKRAVLKIAQAVAAVAVQLKLMTNGKISDAVIQEHALMCLTRGWIEQIVFEAKKIGFQMVHGLEIDRWTNPQSPVVARPWLAVMDKSAISPPDWI